MPERFICQHAREGRLKIIHLSLHSDGVTSHFYYSGSPDIIKRKFSEDDLWNVTEDEKGIHLTPAPRAGTNGSKRA